MRRSASSAVVGVVGAAIGPVGADSVAVEEPPTTTGQGQGQVQVQVTLDFPPPNAIRYGFTPFRWYNTIDTESPMQFLLAQHNIMHPSTDAQCKQTTEATTGRHKDDSESYHHNDNDNGNDNANANSMPPHTPARFASLLSVPFDASVDSSLPSDRWGCSCPNGHCDPLYCSCAQFAQNQYSRSSRVTSQLQPQSICECWKYCSCNQRTKTNRRQTHNAKTEQTNPNDNLTMQVTSAERNPRLAMNHSAAGQTDSVAIVGSEVLRIDAPLSSSVDAAPNPAERDVRLPSLSSLPPTHTHTHPPTGVARSACFNRVVQYGPVAAGIELVVFKTANKGFGVKTLTRIPRFSFVCEYIGEVIHEHISEQRGMVYRSRQRSNYLFSPEVVQTTSLRSSSLHEEEGYNVDRECFTIDSQRVGHIARFVNHSCSRANLISTNVYIQHRTDLRLPRVAFFANQTIEPGTELTVYYGYKDAIETEFTCKCDSCQEEEKANQPRSKKAKLTPTAPPIPLCPSSSIAPSLSSPSCLPSPLTCDPLSSVPLPSTLILLDSNSPPPTYAQLIDPKHIYCATNTIEGFTAQRACAPTATPTRHDSLSMAPAYLRALHQLVGVGACIPIELSCCRVHIHPSRLTLACAVLQNQFTEGRSLIWHQRQIEIMRGIKTAEFDKEIKARSKEMNAPHASSTSASTPFQFACGVCSVSFPSRLQLCTHRRLHSSLSTCIDCGESFTAESFLEWHQYRSNSTHNSTPSTLTLAHTITHNKYNSTPPSQQQPQPHKRDTEQTPINHTKHTRANQRFIHAASTSTSASARSHATPTGPTNPNDTDNGNPTHFLCASHVDPSPPIPTTIMPVLHFQHTMVRMASITPAGASQPIPMVFSSDLAKLLELAHQTHYAFLGIISSDPSFCRPLSVHPTSTGLQLVKSSRRPFLCLTRLGCMRYFDVHQEEVRRRPGLRQWIETTLSNAITPTNNNNNNNNNQSNDATTTSSPAPTVSANLSLPVPPSHSHAHRQHQPDSAACVRVKIEGAQEHKHARAHQHTHTHMDGMTITGNHHRLESTNLSGIAHAPAPVAAPPISTPVWPTATPLIDPNPVCSPVPVPFSVPIELTAVMSTSIRIPPLPLPLPLPSCGEADRQQHQQHHDHDDDGSVARTAANQREQKSAINPIRVDNESEHQPDGTGAERVNGAAADGHAYTYWV